MNADQTDILALNEKLIADRAGATTVIEQLRKYNGAVQAKADEATKQRRWRSNSVTSSTMVLLSNGRGHGTITTRMPAIIRTSRWACMQRTIRSNNGLKPTPSKPGIRTQTLLLLRSNGSAW